MYLLLNDEERKELGEHYASLISFLDSIPVENSTVTIITTESDLAPDNIKDLILDVLEASREEGSIHKYKAAAMIETVVMSSILNFIHDKINENTGNSPTTE